MASTKTPDPSKQHELEARRLRERAEKVPVDSVQAFTGGAGAFFRGLALVYRNPGLWPLIIAPTILTLILYIALIVAAYVFYADFQAAFFAERTEWYWRWGAQYFLWLIFWVLVIVVSFFTYVAVGSVLTSPFNDLISERIERILIPDLLGRPTTILDMILEILRCLFHELLRLGLLLVILLALLPLHLIPVIGSLAFTLLWAYTAIRYLAYDGVAYCMERRRLSFSQKSLYLRRHRARTVGFGAVVFALLLFPPTTLFVLPLMAAGGSVLFCEIASGTGDLGVDPGASASGPGTG